MARPGAIARRRDAYARPRRGEIVREQSSNIGRCTGYRRIIDAVELAAERLRRQEPGSIRPSDDDLRGRATGAQPLTLWPGRVPIRLRARCDTERGAILALAVDALRDWLYGDTVPPMPGHPDWTADPVAVAPTPAATSGPALPTAPGLELHLYKR
jgi:hypothetical protein